MPEFKVLLPLDGSRTAEHSLVYLDALRRLGHCTVELVCVADEAEASHHEGSKDAIERETNLLLTYLHEVGRDVTSHLGVEVVTKVLPGSPATGIIAEAESFKPDLLVISTHGRSGVTRWRLGSVADKVIRSATCNTLVIGPRAHADEVWLDAELKEPFQQILVPLDGSTLGEQALTLAVRYAQCFGSTLHIVRVVGMPVQPAGFLGEGAYIPDLLETLQDVARDNVHKAARGLATSSRCMTHVLTGDPATQLKGYVGAHGIDLVMMASHGRGGFIRTALGSVTDRMLSESAAPVLVVRAG